MLVAFEWIGITVFGVFFLTQIVAPCFFQRLRFFWILREKEIIDKEKELADIKSVRRVRELEEEVYLERDKLRKEYPEKHERKKKASKKTEQDERSKES